MPMYTFHLYSADGRAITLDAVELEHDAATFARAGVLLDEHLSCDHVEVFQGERGVVARYRFQPVIRPVCESLVRVDAGR